MSKLWTLFNFVGLYFCVATFLVSVVIYALAPQESLRAKRAWLITLLSGVGVGGQLLCVPAVDIVAHLRPYKLDYYLFRLDGILGFEPSFWIGSLCREIPILFWTTAFAYNFIAGALLITGIVYVLERPATDVYRVLATSVVNLVGALPIYLLFPVCGPRFVFATFPFRVPSHVPLHSVLLMKGPPNGMPSVHTSTALLIVWFLWRWPICRVLGILFAGLTVLATLGTGEHYLFDLIAAVPYSIAVYHVPIWIASQLASPRRHTFFRFESTSIDRSR